jgi:hypothetical protein
MFTSSGPPTATCRCCESTGVFGPCCRPSARYRFDQWACRSAPKSRLMLMSGCKATHRLPPSKAPHPSRSRRRQRLRNSTTMGDGHIAVGPVDVAALAEILRARPLGSPDDVNPVVYCRGLVLHEHVVAVNDRDAVNDLCAAECDRTSCRDHAWPLLRQQDVGEETVAVDGDAGQCQVVPYKKLGSAPRSSHPAENAAVLDDGNATQRMSPLAGFSRALARQVCFGS